MNKSKSLQGMYDRRYDGLKGMTDTLSLIVAIDLKILSYKTYYDTLDEKTDDLEVGAIGAYIEALNEIKDLILMER